MSDMRRDGIRDVQFLCIFLGYDGVEREKGRKSGGRGHNMKILHEAGNPLASKSLPFTEILEHTGAWQYWGLEYCSV